MKSSLLPMIVLSLLGGILYGVWGISIILKSSIACFVLSAIMELFIVIPFYKQSKQDKITHIVKGDLQKSWKFLRYEKPVFMEICLVIAGLNLLLSAMITIGGLIGGLLTVVQAKTPEHLIGKVIACIMTLIMCVQPVGRLTYGILFEVFSKNTWLVILGTAALSFLIALYSRQIVAQLKKEYANE